MAEAEVLTLDQFRAFLAQTLGMEPAHVTDDASLLNDLAIDSLKLVEMMLQFELQLGINVASEAAWEIETVADAYGYYVQQVRVGGSAGL